MKPASSAPAATPCHTTGEPPRSLISSRTRSLWYLHAICDATLCYGYEAQPPDSTSHLTWLVTGQASQALGKQPTRNQWHAH